jgi:hypothetical protein
LIIVVSPFGWVVWVNGLFGSRCCQRGFMAFE